MGAIFGVVGAVSPSHLDEMGRRLAHRGAAATWSEVAKGVYLGQVAETRRAPQSEKSLSFVIDASHSLEHGSYERVCETFLRERHARNLDRSLTTPFTLAAWDDATHTLLLGRDFLGLKPLHFCRLPGGGIAFATEYKALLAIDDVPARADLNAVRCLQIYKAVPTGRSLLEDVAPVPPGCILHLDREGRVLHKDDMSEVQLAVRPMTEDEACRAIRRRLLQATTPLVEGRSRIGIALSGGIDSVSVACLARKCAPKAELVAFTAGESPEDPEVHRAATVASFLGARHETIVVSTDELLTTLPLAIWHLENPIGRSETFQFFTLAKLARRRGFDYLLSGMGADLLFGGMPRHKVLWLAEAMPMLRTDLLAFFEATQTGEIPQRWLARLITGLYYGGRLPDTPTVFNATQKFVPDLIAPPGPEFLNRCLMLDGQEPTSRTLARIERPLQAYGIEYGSPYLDKSVIEFSFTIPGALKIRNGIQKYILRQAMRPFLSGSMHKAPKALMRMKQNGEFSAALQELADRYLTPERVRRRGFFDLAQVEHIRRACRSRYHPETAMRLWTLIVTELWAEMYVDARGRAPMPAAATRALPEAWGVVHADAAST